MSLHKSSHLKFSVSNVRFAHIHTSCGRWFLQHRESCSLGQAADICTVRVHIMGTDRTVVSMVTSAHAMHSMESGSEQQGSDATMEESAVSWAELFAPPPRGRPHLSEAVGGDAAGTAMAASAPASTAPHASQACSTGSGPEASSETGVQATSELPGLVSLPTEQALRIASFLTALRDDKRPADTSTVTTLLELMRSLPQGPAQKVLIDGIRLEQPQLFERLHESMRRTRERTRATEESDSSQLVTSDCLPRIGLHS
eukprot:2879541-Amphidinium_carterae.1